MTTITPDLAPEAYERLRAEAERLGNSAQVVAQEWLSERLAAPGPGGERERVRATCAPPGCWTNSTRRNSNAQPAAT